jgi:LysM domain
MSPAASNDNQAAGEGPVSVSRHVVSFSAAHDRVGFRPERPRCVNGRLSGGRGSGRLAELRVRAALTVGLLALAIAPPAAAVATAAPDQEYENTAPLDDEAPSTGEAPGFETDFDPGDDGDHGDFDVTPGLGGGEQDDDGAGTPVEAEPPSDPDVLAEMDPPAPPAPAPPAPAAPPATPAPPPAASLPAPPPEPQPTTPGKPHEPEDPAAGGMKRKPDRSSERRRRGAVPPPAAVPLAPPPPIGAPPAPAPVNSFAVTQPPPQDPTTAAPTEARVTGQSYRVRAGDSLWSIARRLLGGAASDAQLAREVARLWRLNEDRIGTGDPDLLFVGTVLRLR